MRFSEVPLWSLSRKAKGDDATSPLRPQSGCECTGLFSTIMSLECALGTLYRLEKATKYWRLENPVTIDDVWNSK
jgi:hypothetical protein